MNQVTHHLHCVLLYDGTRFHIWEIKGIKIIPRLFAALLSTVHYLQIDFQLFPKVLETNSSLSRLNEITKLWSATSVSTISETFEGEKVLTEVSYYKRHSGNKNVSAKETQYTKSKLFGTRHDIFLTQSGSLNDRVFKQLDTLVPASLRDSFQYW
jgi:hypothetical protein